MGKKALVVDNDFFFVEFLSELLELKGFEVVKAYDGKEAMMKLKEDGFSLMFADIIMPKVDGWQLIKHVRKRFFETPFPIVAVSGTIVEQMADLEQIGADYYIIKGPLEKMKQQINEFLDDLESRGGEVKGEKRVYDPGDIYPRREAAELIDSLQFQKAIFESIGIGLIVVDQDGRIMMVNDLALKILDYQSEDLMSRLIPSIFPAGERRRLVDALRSVLKQSGMTGFRYSMTVDGQKIRMVISLFRHEDRQAGWIIALEEMG